MEQKIGAGMCSGVIQCKKIETVAKISHSIGKEAARAFLTLSGSKKSTS